ncbi:EKC/KEOPS complex subunit LAGE3 [Ursus americanus]|uniref:EKC/KEOPS complex subunit LAGE3 n=1 Tax=Ursus americanus TaxID=9643 RepID=UPI001E67B316|nr:EKC/KEOPS complex subunit LAGE3 [Ursus americanus]
MGSPRAQGRKGRLGGKRPQAWRPHEEPVCAGALGSRRALSGNAAGGSRGFPAGPQGRFGEKRPRARQPPRHGPVCACAGRAGSARGAELREEATVPPPPSQSERKCGWSCAQRAGSEAGRGATAMPAAGAGAGGTEGADDDGQGGRGGAGAAAACAARRPRPVSRPQHVPGPGRDAAEAAGRPESRIHVFALCVPFPSRLEAEIACGSLAPDAEPHRGAVEKQLTVSGSVLDIRWRAEDPRLLRISIISFLDQLSLVMRTMWRFGPPVSR